MNLSIFHWIVLTGFAICFVSCGYQLIKIVSAGFPKDYSQPLGKVGPAVIYSFTGAMSPLKKETAYLHLPTYTAGIFFHIGTFFSFILLALVFFSVGLYEWMKILSAVILFISSVSGISILVKRISLPKVSSISNPDDFISNFLVTGFQIISLINLFSDIIPLIFIYSAVLFLYIPVSKLRHTVYFFTSRIHLAFFYGRRGVWPLKRGDI